MVGEDQPLCPDLPELDLSELDVSDLDADTFLGGLKWYSDQSEIISSQYGNEASNLFEVKEGQCAAMFFLSDHACLSLVNLDMILALCSLLWEIVTVSVEFFKKWACQSVLFIS